MDTNNNLPPEVKAPFNEAENCNDCDTLEQTVERLSKLSILDLILTRIPESREFATSYKLGGLICRS